IDTAAQADIEPPVLIDTASQAGIEPPVLIDTAAQADIEPPVLVNTAAQADIEPPVLIDTASQADIEPPVLVHTASQADIDSRERDHQQVVSGRDEVPVESESRMYAQEERVEALKVEVARLEAEREVLLKQAEESQCVTRPDHGNLQQEAVSVNVDTQKELENTTIKLHAAEDRARALSEELRQLQGKLEGTEAHVHRLAAEKEKLVNQIEKQEGDLNSLEIVITGKPSVSPDSTALKEAVKQRLKTDGHIIEQLGSKSEWDDKEKDLLLERNVALENENYRLSQEFHRHLEQQNDQLKADWLQLYKKETESARVEEKP
ncbi:hypothetical protein, partial [Endozoicomonas sp. YOMI1]|uniref:hypothetical protein n=1 Tax=Endozoicomonas sp. YOMI1 TaxID=2828739 RepID=UPI0021478E02